MSGGYKIRVDCEIRNNRIFGYNYNSIQITDEGPIPDDFGSVVITGNVIRPALGGGGTNGIFVQPTNGTYVIEGNVFDDSKVTQDYQCMIYIHNAGLGGNPAYATGGTYIIKNNTGRFTGRHAEAMIFVPPNLKATISENDGILVGDACFRKHEPSTSYRDMIYFIQWDNARRTLRNNRVNAEMQFVDTSADEIITLADHDTLYFDAPTKVVKQIQASGFFTMMNVQDGSVITLESGAHITTLSGQSISLTYMQRAEFVVAHGRGDVVIQLS